MNISVWAIRNPVPSILLFILLGALGLLSFKRLAIQDFPEFDLPLVNITARMEGAAPAQLETEVARKLEDSLATLAQVEHITTTITDGQVSISMQFELDKNEEEALNEVRNAVDATRATLPAGMEEPTVAKVSQLNTPLLTYAIDAGNMTEAELSWFVDNDITKALRSVRGVATVSRVGGVDREIHVDLDPALMDGLEVSIADVSLQLKAVQQDASGGRGELGGGLQSLRTLGALQQPREIAALTLPLPAGRHVRLDQIASIDDSHAERSTRAYVDGREVIGIQIIRSKGASDISVATDVRAAVAQFSAQHPQVTISEISNTVEPIKESYRASLQLLFEGALLAVLVVWIFLRDWRATVVSATALPLSIVPTFAVMAWCGFSLNAISLLALALVVGILVDDAIVEVENIARHLRMGKTPLQAAVDATKEIGLAVVATTLTLVAVFLPTAFMGGIFGKVFRQFGVTAAAAVVASLMVARLLTPMLAAYFMKFVPVTSEEPAWVGRVATWIGACLKHRGLTLGTALLVFVGTLALSPLLSAGFLPTQDNGQIAVVVDLPPGSTIEDTTRVTEQAERQIRTVDGVRQVFAFIGVASADDGADATTMSEVRTATITADLKPRAERRALADVENDLRRVLDEVPGARISVGAVDSDGERLDITLAGDDARQLEAAALALERDVRSLSGIGRVSSNAALQRPEIQIYPDYARAAQLGVTVEALNEAIRMATYGDYSYSLNKLNLPQRQIAVRVRLHAQVRRDLDQLAQLRIRGSHGQIALGSVADIRMGSGIAQISRLDRFRQVAISVELNGRASGDVLDEIRELPSMRTLPKGVFEIQQGEVERMDEMFGSFGFAMGIGVFCIYAVLVLLFRDFFQPATILTALPLSICGVMLALVVTQTQFTMAVVIGILMLMGVVTKNSILLVEYAVMARLEHGMTRFEALLDACRKRARPIVMTTIAMAAGMLPIALGMGADAGFRQPMAIVVIGGVVASTFLSLIVIPVVFTYVDDLVQLLKQRLLAFSHTH